VGKQIRTSQLIFRAGGILYTSQLSDSTPRESDLVGCFVFHKEKILMDVIM